MNFPVSTEKSIGEIHSVNRKTIQANQSYSKEFVIDQKIKCESRKVTLNWEIICDN